MTISTDVVQCALLLLITILSGFSAWRLANMGQTADAIGKLEAKVTEQKAAIVSLTSERDALATDNAALKAAQPDDQDKAAVAGVDGFLAL